MPSLTKKRSADDGMEPGLEGVSAAGAPAPLVQAPIVRINLLPPEIAEKAAIKAAAVRAVIIASVILSLVVLVLLFELNQRRSLTNELEGAQSQQAALTAESNKYKPVTAEYATLAAQEAQYTQAMIREVRFSTILEDVSRTIPPGTQLTQLALTNNLLATETPAASGNLLPEGVGTLTTTGTTNAYSEVSTWIQALNTRVGIRSAFVPSAAENEGEVTYSTNATLTPRAYSLCALPGEPPSVRVLREARANAPEYVDPYAAVRNPKCGGL